jgi:predicted lipoprotein
MAGGSGATGDGAAPVTRQALLEAAAACIAPRVATFVTQATALEAATRTLASGGDAAAKEAARAAFVAAFETWQVLEAMQVGPAAPSRVPGGQDLRDGIYSWPLVSPCAVDGQLVSRGWEAPTFGNALVNRRGLDALEYLLFYEGADSQCAPAMVPAGWAALSADEKEARRRAYAAAVAADVRRLAAALGDAWDPAKGNFGNTLRTAGAGNRTFPTPQAGLNALYEALFYMDGELKDQKVGRPAGLTGCTAMSCPELSEARFAGRGREGVRRNLEGARRLLEGCGDGFSGPGFDDLLEGAGAGPVATRLRERLQAASTAVDAVMQPNLADAIAMDPSPVRALHAALKGVTDLLKMEIRTVLDLELPMNYQGDND